MSGVTRARNMDGRCPDTISDRMMRPGTLLEARETLVWRIIGMG
jgi:hypothetical protein